MCTGYAKDIGVWVCDEANDQRERVMQAWGEGLSDSPEKDESRAWRAALAALGVNKKPVPVDSSGVLFSEGVTK